MTTTRFFRAALRAVLAGLVLAAGGPVVAGEGGQAGAIQVSGAVSASATSLGPTSSLRSDLNQAAGSGFTAVRGADFVNYAMLDRTLLSGVSLASARAGFPVAFSPLPPQSPSQASARAVQAPKPKKANWARRHALLLTGLAMTGGGAALMATGGPGQFSGCLQSGPYGEVQCSTVTTWGASGRHIGGVLLACAGLPLTIWGLVRH